MQELKVVLYRMDAKDGDLQLCVRAAAAVRCGGRVCGGGGCSCQNTAERGCNGVQPGGVAVATRTTGAQPELARADKVQRQGLLGVCGVPRVRHDPVGGCTAPLLPLLHVLQVVQVRRDCAAQGRRGAGAQGTCASGRGTRGAGR